MKLDDESTKTRIDRNKLRAALDKILAIVTPENDPHDGDLTLDGIVRNVERLAEYAEQVTARMNAAHAETLAFRNLHQIGEDGTVRRPVHVMPHNIWNACAAHDARIKAESEAF